MTKKKHKKIIYFIRLYQILFLFLSLSFGFYLIKIVLFSQTCMTKSQVQSDSKCLYILNNKIFEKGTRGSPHKGHACGSDVTSIIPAFHISSPALYLDPNYVGQICTVQIPTVTPKPTSTPTPRPPTATQRPLASPTVRQPTLTPVPLSSATPKPSQPAATVTPAPTGFSPSPTLFDSPTPIPSVSATQSFSPTPRPLGGLADTVTPGIVLSPTRTLLAENKCPLTGDIDCSGAIDDADYQLLISSLNSSNPSADLDKNGWVDSNDAFIFMNAKNKAKPDLIADRVKDEKSEIPGETATPAELPTQALKKADTGKDYSQILGTVSKYLSYSTLLGAAGTIIVILYLKIKLKLNSKK